MNYDTALKTFLRHGREMLRALTGVSVERWLNVELPEVRNRRVDLLGETANGRLVHIELQSTNDPAMALRMLEYCVAIYRRYSRFPEQIVLYVGEAPLRMAGGFSGPHLWFECRVVDIRELDGDRLLQSERLEDNVIAVLARLRDERAAVKQILVRIAAGDPGERADALTGFLILAGLRQLSELIVREVRQVPLLDDIMDHPVLGREFRRGREQGKEEGRQEGELAVLLRLTEKRFGLVPVALRERLANMSVSELDAVALRLLDARSVEELLN
jgi:hypothetical protein